ncbi:MAG: MmcB family DNA repair protein [Pseudomonadota bacterium]
MLSDNRSAPNTLNPQDKTGQITRGVRRWCREQDWPNIAEFSLPNGRRADVLTINGQGIITIIEVKSSIADFRSDQKWPEYRDFCDQFYFAVAGAFPGELIPEDCGLVRADAYGAMVERQAPTHKLAAARRKMLIGKFGRVAALRLQMLEDPWSEQGY